MKFLYDLFMKQPRFWWAGAENTATLKKIMLGSTRFLISQEMRDAAMGVWKTNPTAWLQGQKMLRLPAEWTWWEDPFIKTPGPFKDDEGDGEVFGTNAFLIHERAPLSISIWLFVGSPNEQPTVLSLAPIRLMPVQLDLEITPNDFLITPRRSDYCYQRGWELWRHNMLDDTSDMMVRNLLYVLIAVLMLNTRNLGYVESLPSGLHHKMLRSKNLVPHETFKICKIRLDRIVPRGLSIEGAKAAMLAHHDVRGHFKVRSSGMFWWRPFERGDRGAGRVNKMYEI